MSGSRALLSLAAYLDSSHPTQSCSRLFAHDENEALREALQERLAGLENGRAAWLKLPVGIRRSVELEG